MSADLVTNPGIPYSGNIPGGLFPSKTIYVQGFVAHGTNRFSLNLQSGVGVGVPNVAFHFNPRFEAQKVVVCNTKTNQKWGQEERHHHNFPFGHGQNFELIIQCGPNEFKVAVNGRHFAEYKYRVVNLQQITCFMIEGQVNIYNIRFEPPSAPAYPAAQPAYPPQPVYPAQPVYPSGPTVVNYPSLPYMDTIPGGMKEGKIIVVKVTVKPQPTRFHVNFQCGVSANPRSDVALQFNPRFNQQLINLNTLRSTRWDGNEEKHRNYFPFHPNGTYEIMFLCERHQFKVALNGSHLLEYKHRLPFQNISALQIDGDCVVTQITYH